MFDSTHLASDDVVLYEDGPEIRGKAVDGAVGNVPHQSRLARTVRPK